MDAAACYDVQPGDLVYAATAIRNDGGIPGLAPDALLAECGGRGVVVNIGQVEAEPDTLLFLVRFENPQGEVGPPVGCLQHELSLTPNPTHPE